MTDSMKVLTYFILKIESICYLCYDLAIILISHDLDYVAKYADHVVLLDKTVLKQGSAKEVFSSPEFESVFSVANEEKWIKEDDKND